MDGAAGYLKNLRVKNARQPVKNRYLTCLDQGHKVNSFSLHCIFISLGKFYFYQLGENFAK